MDLIEEVGAHQLAQKLKSSNNVIGKYFKRLRMFALLNKKRRYFMGLFGFGKKKEEKEVKAGKETSSGCCCGGACTPEAVEKATANLENGEAVKVLGSGCAKCNDLEANVKVALEQLGMDTAIEHVTDFNVIAAYGVMTTPALVVDGKVVSYGKVLKVEEAVKLLQKIRS